MEFSGGERNVGGAILSHAYHAPYKKFKITHV